jgi:hypothetical protein
VLCYRLSTTAMLVCSFGNNRVRFRRCMLRVVPPDTPQLLFSYTNPHYRVPPQFRFFYGLVPRRSRPTFVRHKKVTPIIRTFFRLRSPDLRSPSRPKHGYTHARTIWRQQRMSLDPPRQLWVVAFFVVPFWVSV